MPRGVNKFPVYLPEDIRDHLAKIKVAYKLRSFSSAIRLYIALGMIDDAHRFAFPELEKWRKFHKD